MDFNPLAVLHADGQHHTASILFAQMCREALYGRHRVPGDVSHLVHYTTLGTVTSMLGVVAAAEEKCRLATRVPKRDTEERGGSAGYLRLYDTFSSNDPNEGGFFVNAADETGSFRRSYNAVWGLFEDRSASPAYQTSLTYVGDAAEADNLVFWRTYGMEGTGCALAFPIACFEGQSNLFQVRYGKSAASACLGTLSDLLEAYNKIPGAPDFPGMSRISELPEPLVNVLSPLVYLYKSEDYDYEKEVRIVIPFSDLENGLYLQDSSVAGRPTAWRHFAEVPSLRVPQLFVTESHIVLGPTVESTANVQFVLERLLLERQLYGPKVKQSTISYRR